MNARTAPVSYTHLDVYKRQLLVLAALLAPWIAPQNPYDLAAITILDGRMPPGSQGIYGDIYWAGTDAQGRDMLSAMMYGLRTSLSVGVLSGLFAMAVGTVLGLSLIHI